MERNVAKLEWGTKRFCPSCGAPFYDLNKVPIVCPKCESSFEPEQLTRLKRSRSVPAEPKAAAEKKKDEAEEAESEDSVEEENDDAVLEDASDLGGDDELAEVVENSPEEKKDDA
tara:strand:- start:947 stop:1291 length:345 start_codon:yes stop_codon:yes gene_type:complete